MSDFQNKLWPSFHAEVTEQLQAIELALVHNSNPRELDVDSLFRQFHTIKGGCGMMGFTAMLDIAHAVEDLLTPMRKDSSAIGKAHVELLLQALDTLTQQLQEVEESRQNPTANLALLGKLQELGQQAPALDPDNTTARAPEPIATVTPAPAPESGADFQADTLAPFADLCRSLLPLLVLGKLEQPHSNDEQLQALQKLALEYDLQAIASMLSRPAASRDDSDERHAFYGELIDRLAWLEQLSGLDCGVQDTVMLVRLQHGQALSAAIARASEAIAHLAAQPDTTELPGVAGNGAHACGLLLGEAMLMQHTATVRLMRLLRQLLREIQRRQPAHHPGLCELLTLAVQIPAELADGREENTDYRQMCESLHEQIRQLSSTLERPEAGDDSGNDISNRIRQSIDIPDNLLDTLSGKSLRELHQAVEQRKRVAELVADPESQNDAGQAFMRWLRQHCTPISSETIFDGSFDQHLANATRHRFLIAFELDADQLQQQLDELFGGPHLYDLTLFYYQGETRPESRKSSVKHTRTGSTLRIDSAALDQFVNRVGELVMLRNQMNHYLDNNDLLLQQRKMLRLLQQRDSQRPLSNEELGQLRQLLADMALRDERLLQTDQRLQLGLERMQEDALALRVVPIGMVFNRFPRVVRDISTAQDKQVHLAMSGEAVRIDKSLLEILIDPLMHMIRNAVDHGIESPHERQQAGKPEEATLTLAASQQGNTLFVEVRDDGRGLDKDKIRAQALENRLATESELQRMDARELFSLIFQPGFSTSEKVTDVSGRGVGMDVVKSRVMQIGGQVDIRSTLGQGTTFTLRLPLTAAIQTVVLVAAGKHRIALPERNVAEVISLHSSQLTSVQNQACLTLRGHTLPVYRLDALLGQNHAPDTPNRQRELVVLSDGSSRIGLIVDAILGRPEIFIRDTHPGITALSGIGGVSVLGDGSLVIIADCENLFDLALRKAQSLRSLVQSQ